MSSSVYKRFKHAAIERLQLHCAEVGYDVMSNVALVRLPRALGQLALDDGKPLVGEEVLERLADRRDVGSLSCVDSELIECGLSGGLCFEAASLDLPTAAVCLQREFDDKPPRAVGWIFSRYRAAHDSAFFRGAAGFSDSSRSAACRAHLQVFEVIREAAQLGLPAIEISNGRG